MSQLFNAAAQLQWFFQFGYNLSDQRVNTRQLLFLCVLAASWAYSCNVPCVLKSLELSWHGCMFCLSMAAVSYFRVPVLPQKGHMQPVKASVDDHCAAAGFAMAALPPTGGLLHDSIRAPD